MEAEIDRLHVSIDRLSDVVSGLKEESRRQAARMEALAEKQTADFRALVSMLHENYSRLVDRQDAFATSFSDRLDKVVERQDAGLKSFGDRLDKLVERQDQSATAFGDRLGKLVERQDSSAKAFGDRLDKLVERQDSHFRWLAGLVLASALSIGIALVRLH